MEILTRIYSKLRFVPHAQTDEACRLATEHFTTIRDITTRTGIHGEIIVRVIGETPHNTEDTWDILVGTIEVERTLAKHLLRRPEDV